MSCKIVFVVYDHGITTSMYYVAFCNSSYGNPPMCNSDKKRRTLLHFTRGTPIPGKTCKQNAPVLAHQLFFLWIWRFLVKNWLKFISTCSLYGCLGATLLCSNVKQYTLWLLLKITSSRIFANRIFSSYLFLSLFSRNQHLTGNNCQAVVFLRFVSTLVTMNFA